LARLLREKRRSKGEVLDLTESNPTRAGLDFPEEEILSSMKDRRSLLYEPTPRGLAHSRTQIARYYEHRGKKVTPDDILLTAGTSEAYALAFKLLLDPADQVLIPRPSYPLFDYLLALDDVEAISYPLTYDGSWSFEPSAMEDLVTARARAILLVHPGNPTGAYLKRNELDGIRDIARRHQLALVVDEVFLDYRLTEVPEGVGSLAGENDVLTFVLSGLSKVAGLPQMKLSWICVGGDESVKRQALDRLEHMSDLFLSVGTPVQHALGRFLELAEPIRALILSRIRTNYELLLEPESSSVSVLRAEGGWYAVLRLPAVVSSEQWAMHLLSRQNVYTHPGYLFDFAIEGCLVVSLLTPTETFRDGIRRILEEVERELETMDNADRR
jgi:aspartate/methionine/tyrosine aminotransferase